MTTSTYRLSFIQLCAAKCETVGNEVAEGVPPYAEAVGGVRETDGGAGGDRGGLPGRGQRQGLSRRRSPLSKPAPCQESQEGA